MGRRHFYLRVASHPPPPTSWSGRTAPTLRKLSWAQRMNSPQASALPPVISRGKTGAVKVLGKLGFTVGQPYFPVMGRRGVRVLSYVP